MLLEHDCFGEPTPPPPLLAVPSLPHRGWRATPPGRGATLIEVGEIDAGIVVHDEGGVRFFASRQIFEPLDGCLYGSPDDAWKAARLLAKARPAGRRGHAPRPLHLPPQESVR